MPNHAVLVVDDEANVLKALERALRKEKFTLLTAGSADEGLKLLSAREVSIVISDFQMPKMNGLEFLTQVRADYPHILTIMLTGQGDLEVAVNAINEVGIYKFIQKPWNDQDLIITLRRAMESLDLVLERDRLLQKVKSRDAILRELEKKFPGITKVERDEDGSVMMDE
ncbi:MAG: response regulator [Desulfobacteraceae bacterium]|nr:response regulator [Desulfobacteraceae bacterium]